jgi:heat shock protein HspQ
LQGQPDGAGAVRNPSIGRSHPARDGRAGPPADGTLWLNRDRDAISLCMNKTRNARYKIGEVVRHRVYPFRGVIFDVDPTFANTEEWWESIPAEVRPHKDQPFYHLLAENSETEYIAYVSEQNLLPDTSGDPVRHPQVGEIFERDDEGTYHPRHTSLN